MINPSLSRQGSRLGPDDKREKGPLRRKHKNSKNGCPNCKKRRVKCSEDLPACSNCIKHKVRCGYLDYTEEQLQEVKKAKEIDDLDAKATKPILSLSLSSETKVQSPVSKTSSGKSPQLNLSPQHAIPLTKSNASSPNVPVQRPKTPPHIPKPSGGVNDVLNFHNSITQDFHNLIPTSTDQIIYPVYSIHQPMQQPLVPEALLQESQNFHKLRDVFNSNWAIDDYMYDSSLDFLDYQQPVVRRTLLLPNAQVKPVTFTRLRSTNVDYGKALLLFLKDLTGPITLGKATLPDIRKLYHIWLSSFIYKSLSDEVMFSCLVNLTTNYLISNVLNIPHESFGDLVNKTRAKNILIVHSIKHYAIVIKGLRHFLNINHDLELCASVSYILLLMSIYDPEATLNSTNCFRDGLFGTLHYTLTLAAKYNQKPPTLVPVHLTLMTNVCRSVYMPGYDPHFLHDFNSMLISFGNLIRMIKIETEGSDAANNKTFKFVETMFDQLSSFLNDTINLYVPTITHHLSDFDVQQETLFTMARRWVCLQPSKLTVITRNADPLEKLLYLFFKAFKKGIFAVAPQMKYFFLRDFDSPLMLDVFSNYVDYDIFDSEIDHPPTLCVPEPIYDSIKVQLKILAGYLIRFATFFQIRSKLLYKTIVYEKTTKELFPIPNIRQWRNGITNIEQVRNDFNDIMGLVEVPIPSFSQTLIKPRHFPRVNKLREEIPTVPLGSLDLDKDDVVDFLTLRESGFLVGDAMPNIS